MQIAICDDEQIFRKELRDYLVAYKTERRIHIDIYEFEHGTDFLNSKLIFDMVFMDYQMPDLDGLETAKQLRLKNSLCSIVFITSFSKLFIKDAFEVNTYRFFDKPISRDEIYSMLDSYIAHQKTLAPIMVYDFDGQKTIPFKDIVLIEGDNKYCKIHTTTEIIPCSKTIAGTLRLLPEYCFYRTHKSFAINMYFISKVESDNILMLNGKTAYLSRKYAPGFKKAYRDFVKNYYVRL